MNKQSSYFFAVTPSVITYSKGVPCLDLCKVLFNAAPSSLLVPDE